MPIRARRQAGWWVGLALAVAFSGCLVPLATAELWGPPPFDAAGTVTGFTIRLPEVAVYRDLVSPPTVEFRRMVYARGEALDRRRDAPLVTAFERSRRPPALGLLLGLGLAYLLMGLLFTAYLRNFGYRGRLLRTQVVLTGAIVLVAAVAKAMLLLTALPVFLFPLAALSIAVAAHHDRQAAFAATLLAAMVVGSLVPFDLVAAVVLLMQGLGAVMLLRRRRSVRQRFLVLAGAGGGVAAALVYVAVYFLMQGRLPSEEPTWLLGSGLWATLGGGVGAGLLAPVLAPLFAWTLRQVSRARLLELANLNQPLLRQIATRAPGTWAHSLAMANMAEVAATAIDADALLTRVGAYYHDLGKSLHPQYYIENLGAGEQSPHELLAPEESAHKIFAHCSDGVRLGEQARLPQPVLDFMHMHHGNGLLEYFFHKNQELGNPRGLDERDFRYPGIPPQTKETAILAICDAVEAASRTLREPDERSVTQLVQRIVFGKLRLGQLDESGLTSSDLKLLSSALIDTLKSSFHVRIEYPWQREERAAAMAAGAVPVPSEDRATSATQRFLVEPRLDSTDVPRPPGTASSRPARPQD